MKAIDIVDEMTRDSTLAEVSMVVEYDTWNGTHPVREWCKETFDAEPISAGRLLEGKYLCVYAVHEDDIYPFIVRHAPEIYLKRINPEEYPEDDRFIWLWKIE